MLLARGRGLKCWAHHFLLTSFFLGGFPSFWLFFSWICWLCQASHSLARFCFIQTCVRPLRGRRLEGEAAARRTRWALLLSGSHSRRPGLLASAVRLVTSEELYPAWPWSSLCATSRLSTTCSCCMYSEPKSRSLSKSGSAGRKHAARCW